ncbi:arylamine N-acetyltransferase [Neobacillus sp. NPDC058068]|uniref:arylamine N-acetyltransferase family protein n=1 Tax=Neobacillus sp. NPDC058068 TaxID=3346325 RepID=UPI0036D88407
MEQLIKRLKENGLLEIQTPVEKAAFVLRQFAEWFPFENTDVMNGIETDISPEYLIQKMVLQKRGGLCYEINPLLLLVLQEIGFDAKLGAGTIVNNGKWALDQTHALVLLQLDGKKYIADSGFGSHLALSPLKLDAEAVTSPAGTFRLRTHQTEKGSMVLECLNEQNEWYIRYAFDWEPVPWRLLSDMKRAIHKNPLSPFNKELLIARVLQDGTESINEKRQHRKWTDGREETIMFENEDKLIETVRRNFPSDLIKQVQNHLLFHD